MFVVLFSIDVKDRMANKNSNDEINDDLNQNRESLSSPFPHQVKLVVVGDGTVGKTCLLTVFVEKRFPTEYEPTIFNNLEYKICIDGLVSHVILIIINDLKTPLR